ncbi:MAG: aspartate aminotransferase family protein [Pseudomonadales bacterium]|nr:aspartate aminotransferase family protein [Pseudomonadales bacterium]
MSNTQQLEDEYGIGFFQKQPVVVDRGEGVWAYTEANEKYLDFTSGWAVTCLGHAHPVITEAIIRQSQKIIQNPNSGLTYSPSRAQLLKCLVPLLPANLTALFFTNSGAEANDAALKLARKITGRRKVISTRQSFHGRTLSALAVTGEREKHLVFGTGDHAVSFVDFNDLEVLADVLDADTAALIIEPIQGEGGINIPAEDYLPAVSKMCKANGTLLIVDEVQTGFCRTGEFFATTSMDINIDFLTIAKGMGGGFPIGAFAVNPATAAKIEIGDHGGTYCGNPLACAVANAVIDYLDKNDIAARVQQLGKIALQQLNLLKSENVIIKAVRGKGLLLVVEFENTMQATQVVENCLANALFVTQTQGRMIRLLPALTITEAEWQEGFRRFSDSVKALAVDS